MPDNAEQAESARSQEVFCATTYQLERGCQRGVDNSYKNMAYCHMEKPTMISADLGNTLETFVSDLVKSGRYNSKSEVLREGVRLVQEREARLTVLDAALARGIADADAGRVKPAAAVFDRLEEKYQAMAKAKSR
jgi:antitoxin ParD1/3/4